MKIEKLNFCNINSLAGEFEVDFLHPELAGPGIFVITGPTGSGKSSILDAISFALYGRSPRQVRFQPDENEIMTHGADACSATVQYEQGGVHYRSTVSQARSKRGSNPFGLVKYSLYRLNEQKEWELMANKKGDFERLTEQITGLSFENFTRCMLLAQGDFAVFLKAGEKERAEILSTITGTEIYSRIGDIAHSHVADVQHKIDALQSLPEMEEEQRSKLEQARDEAEAKQKELEEILTRVKSCRNWLQEVDKKKKTVEREQEKARNAAQEWEEFKRTEAVNLSRAEAALAVKPAALALHTAAENLRKHTADVETTQGDCHKVKKVLGEKKTAAENALQQQLVEAPTLEAALASVREQMRPQEAELTLLKNTAVSTEKEAAEKSGELEKAENALKSLQQKVEKLNKELENLRSEQQKNSCEAAWNERLPLLQARLEDWQKAPRAAVKLPPHEQLEAEKLAMQQQVPAEEQRLENLRDIAELLRRQLGIEEQLAALYLDFREGRLERCPCCGSSVPGERRAVLNEEVQAAEDRVKSAEKELKNARARLEKLEQLHRASLLRCAFCEALGQEVADLPAAQKLVQELSRRRDEYQALCIKLAECEKKYHRFSAQLQADSARVEELRKTAAEHTKKWQDAAELYNTGSQSFALRWGAGNTAEALEKQHVAALKKLSDAVQDAESALRKQQLLATGAESKLSELERQFPAISAAYQNCEANFTKLLAEHHFADKADYESAESLVQLLPQLREAHRRLAEAAGTTAGVEKNVVEELNLLLAESPLQEGETEETLAQQEAGFQALQAQNRELLDTLLGELRADDLAHAANKETAALKKQLEIERDRHALLKKVLGDTRDGFRKFAQQITFDMLLRRANAELRHLTERYELRRRTTQDDPLGLVVIDHELGIAEGRSASNLSGGESFLVSLALALGLSHMAGTTRIDSLFLDEGFGTLDADTLQHVLTSLQKLRANGKMIGIISHVPALSDRIPARIQVSPRRGGFSTLYGSDAVKCK